MEQLEDRALLATLSLGPSGLHVAEGGTATLQATLSQVEMQPVTVYFRTMPGTAIENADYTGIPSGSVTIPPGATWANIGVSALNDIDLEGTETFSVELTGASGATINPAAAAIQVTIDNVQSGGGGGGSQGNVTVALSLESSVAQNGIDEGAVFALTGSINLPGYYLISGVINWGTSASEGGGTSQFTVSTNPSATPNAVFTVFHRYLDDGPDPGNGTPSDEQPITITGTATPMMPGGGGNLSVTGSTSVTIHNVPPEPIFDIYNYMPIGGPRWIAAGVFQDAGLTDRGSVEIDWGDGSPPYTLSDVPVGTEFSQMHQYPPDGLGYRITITLTDDDTAVVSYHEDIGLYLLDLDNDANNNGEISSLDEGYEPPTPGPGRYISVNADDDNENGIPDMNEAGPISGENDLEPFLVRWRGDMRPDINNYAGWHLTLEVLNWNPGEYFQNPRIWLNPDKSGGELALFDLSPLSDGHGTEWTIGTESIPEILYLEARQTNGIGLELRLWTPPGEHVEADTVAFLALAAETDVNLEIYHGQNGKVVSMADEGTRGAVTVANINDTDVDGTPDKDDNQVLETDGVKKNGVFRGRNELDLMRLDVHKPVGYVAGMPVTLTVSNATRIQLWKKFTKEDAIALDGDKVVVLDWGANDWATNATTGTKTIWVEITSYSESVHDLSLTLTYGEKSNTVLATGIWAEGTVYQSDDVDFDQDLTKWPLPWKNAPEDVKQCIVGASGGKFKIPGTGLRPPWTDSDGFRRFHNAILFEFQVFPKNAQAFFKDVVRFALTRQKAWKSWDVTSTGVTPTANEDFPNKAEQPNDDGYTPGDYRDESMEPDKFGMMYTMDAPFLAMAGGADGDKAYARWNFFEYVRVTLNGNKPDGDELLGSQSSPNYLWHARVAIGRAGGTVSRINDATAGQVNDIGPQHKTLGDNP